MDCGYYQFEDAETKERWGSFEIYETDEGFFWHACHPGCLPDGEPEGPFSDASDAYEDALDYGYR